MTPRCRVYVWLRSVMFMYNSAVSSLCRTPRCCVYVWLRSVVFMYDSAVLCLCMTLRCAGHQRINQQKNGSLWWNGLCLAFVYMLVYWLRKYTYFIYTARVLIRCICCKCHVTGSACVVKQKIEYFWYSVDTVTSCFLTPSLMNLLFTIPVKFCSKWITILYFLKGIVNIYWAGK